ncbi:MAG: hypothetical protein ACTHLJ_09000 [Angustibacter sp.]
MSIHELLDEAADQAMAGRRVTGLDIRRLRADRRRGRARRGLVVAAACLAVLIPLALLAAGGWAPSREAQPAGRDGGFVVPTRVFDLRDARPLIDSSGEVVAGRLSMAFLGTLRGQLTPVGLDAATGRAVLLPELGTDVPGLAADALADVSESAVPVLVALSPDGRTVAVSYQNPWDAWDLVFDLAAGKAKLVHQKAPVGAGGADLLTVAALDGGRYALPTDDVTGVRVGQVGGGERDIALRGMQAGAGLVVEPGANGAVLVTAERGGRPWLWSADGDTGPVTDAAAGWVPTSGWAASRPDDAGRLVALDGDRLVAHDLRTGAATVVSQIQVNGQTTRDLRVVSAAGDRVVVTDDGRQRTARFVSGAEPHRLLAVGPSGALQTLTTFALPRSDSGPAVSSLAVAPSVLATARATTVVPGDGALSGWWWLLLLVPVALGGAALWLRSGGSADTDQPGEPAGRPRRGRSSLPAAVRQRHDGGGRERTREAPVAATRTMSLQRVAAVSTTFAVLLGIAVVAPLLGMPQLITGTIVNADLFVAVVLVGPRGAVGVAALPSLFAVASGQLPSPLAGLVPVIVLGNVLLVGVFELLRQKGWWLGVVVAAVAKFAWLFGVTSLVAAVTHLLAAPVVPVALVMMGWPQLATALAGGVVAYAVLDPPGRRR